MHFEKGSECFKSSTHNCTFVPLNRTDNSMPQSLIKEKILYIINPNSGTSFKGHLPDLINKLTDSTFFDAEVCYTRYKGEATEIVHQKLTENYRYFVAVGGDGTVNEIAKALINTQATMGIIPAGSGNGLARHLKIPLSPQKAIEVINKRKSDSIDYGLINDLPFFCTCGVGFDALISEKFDQSKGRGLLNYVKTTFLEFFNYKPETYQIATDDQEFTERKAFLITVANASQYGNNARIAPRADIQDGKLEICILSPFRLYQALSIGIRLFTGNIEKSSLLDIRGTSKILLKREKGGTIHIDGENRQLGKNLHLSVINRGLKVIIP